MTDTPQSFPLVLAACQTSDHREQELYETMRDEMGPEMLERLLARLAQAHGQSDRDDEVEILNKLHQAHKSEDSVQVRLIASLKEVIDIQKKQIDALRASGAAHKTTFISTLQSLYVAAQVDANTGCDRIGELRRPRWKAVKALLTCIHAFAKLPREEIELVPVPSGTHMSELERDPPVQKFRDESGCDDFADSLKPHLVELMKEGKKNMATMSPPTVAYHTGMIMGLLDTWLGKTPKPRRYRGSVHH